VTELAVTFAVSSTKMGEGNSGDGGRLPEEEERRIVSVVTCQETKRADVMIPESHTLSTTKVPTREMRASFIFLSNSVDYCVEAL
jgi:hypothetical protein